jgi:hypothetical protein
LLSFIPFFLDMICYRSNTIHAWYYWQSIRSYRKNSLRAMADTSSMPIANNAKN